MSTEDGVPLWPGAWRARVAPGTNLGDDPEVTVAAAQDGPDDPPASSPQAVVDGQPRSIHLDRRDEARAVLVEGPGPDPWRTPILFGPRHGPGPSGVIERELVVDGWRIEVEVELAARAALRERARRTGSYGPGGGRGEVRAIIPGKIVAVDVRPGDPVAAGQRLLVLAAMKMQNELTAPREGVVETVAVDPGATVERGDLLVVIR